MKSFRDRAITLVIFDGGIEVVGDKFTILETKLVDNYINSIAPFVGTAKT